MKLGLAQSGHIQKRHEHRRWDLPHSCPESSIHLGAQPKVEGFWLAVNFPQFEDVLRGLAQPVATRGAGGPASEETWQCDIACFYIGPFFGSALNPKSFPLASRQKVNRCTSSNHMNRHAFQLTLAEELDEEIAETLHTLEARRGGGVGVGSLGVRGPSTHVGHCFRVLEFQV